MKKMDDVKFSELKFVKMGKCTPQLRRDAKFSMEYASDITEFIDSLCGYKLIFTDLCVPFKKGFIDMLMLFRNDSKNGREYITVYLDMAGALLAEKPEDFDICYPVKMRYGKLNVPNREICFDNDIYPVSDLSEIVDREKYLEQCRKNCIKLKTIKQDIRKDL